MSAADISATDILRKGYEKVSGSTPPPNGHGIHGPPHHPSTLVPPLPLLDAKASQLDPAQGGEEGKVEFGWGGLGFRGFRG